MYFTTSKQSNPAQKEKRGRDKKKANANLEQDKIIRSTVAKYFDVNVLKCIQGYTFLEYSKGEKSQCIVLYGRFQRNCS